MWEKGRTNGLGPKLFLVLALGAAGIANTAQAWAYANWAVGINAPGAHVRHLPWKDLAVDLKVQGDSQVLSLGPRVQYYFWDAGAWRAYAGAEGDLLTFTGEVSKGSGWAAEVLAGAEYFFYGPFSVQADIGPAWVQIQDQATGIRVGSSAEWVLFLGLNWYFGEGAVR